MMRTNEKRISWARLSEIATTLKEWNCGIPQRHYEKASH